MPIGEFAPDRSFDSMITLYTFNISTMKKFIIERKIPGVGSMTAEELQALSKTSNAVISILGTPYVWVESYITEDKMYCIHEATDEEDILEHAKCGNFPINGIEEIKAIINPASGDRIPQR